MRSLTVLLFIFSTSCWAKCSLTGMWAYPAQKVIPQNSKIVVVGHAKSQKSIDSLNTKHPVFLVSENHTVKMVVTQIEKGNFRYTQAILEPTEALKPNETYFLQIDSLDQWISKQETQEKSITYNTQSSSWTIADTSDLQAPLWIETPAFKSSSYSRLGSGPSVSINFDYIVSEPMHTLIKTELVDLTENTTATYLMPSSNTSTLSIGHSMCSGAFTFKNDNQYKIRFSLIDYAGNSDNNWTEWYHFDSPFITSLH